MPDLTITEEDQPDEDRPDVLSPAAEIAELRRAARQGRAALHTLETRLSRAARALAHGTDRPFTGASRAAAERDVATATGEIHRLRALLHLAPPEPEAAP